MKVRRVVFSHGSDIFVLKQRKDNGRECNEYALVHYMDYNDFLDGADVVLDCIPLQ